MKRNLPTLSFYQAVLASHLSKSIDNLDDIKILPVHLLEFFLEGTFLPVILIMISLFFSGEPRVIHIDSMIVVNNSG